MKRILITNRRYGSRLVHKYIECANTSKHVLSIHNSTEFLNYRNTSFYTGHYHVASYQDTYQDNIWLGDKFSSIELKIKFLEEQRKKGIEYSHKVIPIHFIECNMDIKGWFDEFYKDWEKVILHRKNKWNPFLSYVIQDNLRDQLGNSEWEDEFTHSLRNHPVEERIISNLKPFYVTHYNIEYFWYHEDLLNTWDGTKIYLEDHMPDAHNSLCSYFNINMPQKIFKIKLNYEKYVLNLAEAKDWFYKYGI